MTPNEALEKLQKACVDSPELLKGEYANVDRTKIPLNGYCYPLSEALYHLFPKRYTPWRVGYSKQQGGGSHWFLRDNAGKIMETIVKDGAATACNPKTYAMAQRQRRFLTAQPSKRCLALIEKAGLALPNYSE